MDIIWIGWVQTQSGYHGRAGGRAGGEKRYAEAHVQSLLPFLGFGFVSRLLLLLLLPISSHPS